MKKPTPKVAVVSSSEAYWLSVGKNNREMTTVRKPKIMKSYHSSAFPTTAAAIWRVFGADRLAGIMGLLGARTEREKVGRQHQCKWRAPNSIVDSGTGYVNSCIVEPKTHTSETQFLAEPGLFRIVLD